MEKYKNPTLDLPGYNLNSFQTGPKVYMVNYKRLSALQPKLTSSSRTSDSSFSVIGLIEWNMNMLITSGVSHWPLPPPAGKYHQLQAYANA